LTAALLGIIIAIGALLAEWLVRRFGFGWTFVGSGGRMPQLFRKAARGSQPFQMYNRHLMPIQFNNNVPNPYSSDLLETIITQEIGDRNGDWMVRILEDQPSRAWAIKIVGPNLFLWGATFEGDYEQRGRIIRQSVRRALQRHT
jgi:hypothetical protein